MKTPTIPSFYIESDFDAWLSGASNGISGAFSDYAKQHGRAELKHFNDIHEYSLYRFSNDLDNVGGNLGEILGIDFD